MTDEQWTRVEHAIKVVASYFAVAIICWGIWRVYSVTSEAISEVIGKHRESESELCRVVCQDFGGCERWQSSLWSDVTVVICSDGEVVRL